MDTSPARVRSHLDPTGLHWWGPVVPHRAPTRAHGNLRSRDPRLRTIFGHAAPPFGHAAPPLGRACLCISKSRSLLSLCKCGRGRTSPARSPRPKMTMPSHLTTLCTINASRHGPPWIFSSPTLLQPPPPLHDEPPPPPPDDDDEPPPPPPSDNEEPPPEARAVNGVQNRMQSSPSVAMPPRLLLASSPPPRLFALSNVCNSFTMRLCAAPHMRPPRSVQ